ncbi:MAG: double-strand break repair helicase AddA [Rhizobiales bacterium]|nr:double-strand break repair helicase AddA [Hyphomicrobiales bacterium]
MTADHQASVLQRRASDPTASAWVNANAGSGKTHVLVDRLIRLMLTGTNPSRILCLTFTRAAAAEMSTRLFDRLSAWIAFSDEELEQDLRQIGLNNFGPDIFKEARRLFTSALETPGGLKIQTIHAFCERLLQLFPVEAGIVPHFSVMDDRAAREVLRAARQDVLRKAKNDPSGKLSAALAEVVRHARADDFDDLLDGILSERANLDFCLGGEANIERAVQDLRRRLSLTPEEDAASTRVALALDQLECRRLIECLKIGTAKDCERGAALAKVLTSGKSNLEELREFYLTGEDQPRKLSGIATKAVLMAHPWIENFITSEQQRLMQGLGKLADLERVTATSSLLTLATAIVQAFEEEKRRRGAYDFDDLIIRTCRLLAERPEAAWVLYKLDGGIEHILLDEAQDTSPAQWEIVRALTTEFFSGRGVRGEPDRTLFAVGDRKQSIYSFQGADPDIFELVHDDFRDRIRAAGQTFNDVDFMVSFRSTAAILQAVDAVFHESCVARQGLDGRSAKQLHHEPNRRDKPGTVEIWPLIEPEDRVEDQPWQAPVDREPANSPRRKLARLIATKVKSWIGARMLAALNRPVQPGDILILVRVRNSFFDALIRELRKAGIPVAGADRLKLMESIAILDMLALARFCLLEDDDYSLACLLKSPLLAMPLSEGELFEIAWRREAHSLWEMLQQSTAPRCIAAVQRLSTWKAYARTARPYEFFAGVLGQTRGKILSRLGSEAKDALEAFLGAALDYERDHTSSLQGFVHWFLSGDAEIKRDMEQASTEVRIMTVHGAKGLEAPIVIMPDTVSMPDGRTQSSLMMIGEATTGTKMPLWALPKRFASPGIASLKAAQRDDQSYEYRRLLYVAMTRARDELYVCGYRGRNDPADECWYNLVTSALLPEMRQTEDGSVWRLGDDPVFVREAPVVEMEKIEIPAWVLRAPEAEPGFSLWSAPSHLGDVSSFPQVNSDRQQGLQRGASIHRILQLLPNVPPAKRRDFVMGMIIKAGHDETAALRLLALTERSDLRDVFSTGGLSEIPVVGWIKELGRTISGRIDRLIFRQDEIVIVDYKTDRDWPAAPEFIKRSYRLQMAAYRAALRGMHSGTAVRCAILWTAAPLFMEIPDFLLEETLHHKTVAPA